MSSAKAAYDRDADTLYLTVSPGVNARYHEDDDGLVWRLAEDGTVFSVTIMDYEAYWASRFERLTELLSIPLRVDRQQVASLLHH